MNASWMINLYPQAWRERYEDEFRAMLADQPTAPSEMFDILAGAVDAHLRPQLHTQPTSSAGMTGSLKRRTEPVRSQGFQAFFLAHATLFIIVNIALVILNLIVTPDQWWFPYVMWGWGMVLIVHAGITYPWKHYFGAHVTLYALLNAGLIAINVHNGGPAWSIWPLVSLGVLLVTHGLIAFRRISLFQAYKLATALACLELMFVAIIGGMDVFWQMVLIGAELWVIVLALWLMRFRGWSLFGAHVVTYTGIMSLLAINNAIDSAEGWWVRYPVLVWGAILLVHGVAHISRSRSGHTWESAMLGQLGSRANETPRQRRVRTFMFHAGAFVLGSCVLLLLDAIDDSGGGWALWPIGAWAVVLAMHAGLVVMPRRIFGLHLLTWLVVSAGLIAIDAVTSGGPWWFWPVMWWGVIVAIHAGMLLPTRLPATGMHLTGAIGLSAALVVTDLITGPPTWWYYPVGVIAFTLLMHFGWIIERSMAMRQGLSRDQR